MLLYIGEMMEAGYLQQLSNQLKQAICLVDAPEDPLELVALVQPQYSHYMIRINPYEHRPKELVKGLRRFIDSAEGKLMLLATHMTTDSAVIRELMYAGFVNIYFLDADTCKEIEPVKVHASTVKLQVKEVVTGDYQPTESMNTVPMALNLAHTEPMVVEEENLPCLLQKQSKREGRQNHRFTVCCCLIIILLVVIDIGVASYLLTEDTNIQRIGEHYVQRETSTIPTEPVSSLQVQNERTTTVPSTIELPDATPQMSPSIPPLTAVDGSTTVVPMEEPTEQQTEQPAQQPTAQKVKKPAEQLPAEASTPKPVPIHSLSLPESLRMVKGGTIVLEPEYKPLEASQTSFSWKSNNTELATVKNGRVTAKKTGVVTITVTTSNGKKAKCRIIIGDE